MRRILVDHARAKRASAVASSTRSLSSSSPSRKSRISISSLSTKLSTAWVNSRLARAGSVEMHFFAGLSFDEIGELLG